MPFAPKHPCRTIGCANLTNESLCAQCLENGIKLENRPSARERGYDERWQVYRLRFLACNPFCADPFHKHHSERVRATVVDHVIPHQGNENLFWDWQNHSALCKQCHDYKTGKFDGGFGRVRVSKMAPQSVPFTKMGGRG